MEPSGLVPDAIKNVRPTLTRKGTRKNLVNFSEKGEVPFFWSGMTEWLEGRD